MKQLKLPEAKVYRPDPNEPDAWIISMPEEGLVDPEEGRYAILPEGRDGTCPNVLQLPDFDKAWRTLETLANRAFSEMLYFHEGAWVLIWPATPEQAASRPGAIVPGAKVRLLPQYALRNERGRELRPVLTVREVHPRPQQGPLVSFLETEGLLEACCLTTDLTDLAGGGQ